MAWVEDGHGVSSSVSWGQPGGWKAQTFAVPVRGTLSSASRRGDTGSNGWRAGVGRRSDMFVEPLDRRRLDDGNRGGAELVAFTRVLVPLDGQTGGKTPKASPSRRGLLTISHLVGRCIRPARPKGLEPLTF